MHLRHRLDTSIHSPARFSIMAILVAADKVEFRFVRDTVELSDSALSQHLTALEKVGYIKVTKGQVGRRTRTWIAATADGRAAFHEHLNVLNEIAEASANEEPE